MRFDSGSAGHQRCVAAVRGPDDGQRGDRAERGLDAFRAQIAPAALHGGGSVWSDIERLAADLAAREPVLRDLVDQTGSFGATPARTVSAVLSHRLGWNDRKLGATVRTVVLETLCEDPAVLEFLEADLLAVASNDPACRSALHALLDFKGFQALQGHRVAHSLWRRGRFDLALWLSSRCSAALGVDIHPAAPIGKGVMLDHGSGIVIGETALVEDDVTILHGVTLGGTGKQRGDRHPKVRYGAFLGAGATVLGNIEIGRMSRVGAGSVVLRSVPPYCTVTGVAARVVRTGPASAVQRIAASGWSS